MGFWANSKSPESYFLESNFIRIWGNINILGLKEKLSKKRFTRIGFITVFTFFPEYL